MQSEEWGDPAGIGAVDAHRYAIFQLAAMLQAPEWRNNLSLAFPASDVAGLDGKALTPACAGLLGVAGALPFAYTEAVARVEGHAARAFLDLLAAPALDMFCAAWRAARPEHMPLPALPARRGPLRARALGELLAQSLGVPVHIRQFVGRWERLPAGQASALGGQHACCGSGASLGERLWRLDSAVLVVIGPVDWAAAQIFLPGGQGARVLAQQWEALAGSGGGAGDGGAGGGRGVRHGGPGDGAGGTGEPGEPGGGGGEGGDGGGAGVRAEACILLRAGALSGAALGVGARLGYDALLLAAQSVGERDDLRYRLC